MEENIHIKSYHIYFTLGFWSLGKYRLSLITLKTQFLKVQAIFDKNCLFLLLLSGPTTSIMYIQYNCGSMMKSHFMTK